MTTILDLLAVIHGDGGHHTGEVGLDQSIVDAIQRVSHDRSAGDNLSGLRGILRVQGQNGNWNCDEYMLGLYNGLEMALATLEGRDPVFRTGPVPAWRPVSAQAFVDTAVVDTAVVERSEWTNDLPAGGV